MAYDGYDDDLPGWSFERDIQGLGIGLHNSRPINVYRHTAYPQYRRAITQAIDGALVRSLEKAGTLTGLGIGSIRLGGKKVDWLEEDVEEEQPPYPPTSASTSSTTNANWIDIRPQLLEHLGYRGPRAGHDYQQLRNHLRIVLLDGYVCAAEDPERWIGYSRNDSSYLRQSSRYNRLRLSRGFLCAAVDLLADAGFLESWKPEADARGMQSRFRSKAPLLTLLSAAPVGQITQDRRLEETIVLMGVKSKKTGKAKFIEYDDADHDNKPKQWRENLEVINRQIAASDIGIDLPSDIIKKYRIDLARKRLHRVFNNEDWGQGGRFYGGWWIGMSNRKTDFRRRITIDGSPVVEVDYSQIHPTLLYAQASARLVAREGVVVAVPGEGVRVPTDSYALPGYDRNLVKTIFNTMLNVGSRQGIHGAVVDAAKKETVRAAKEDALLRGVPYKKPKKFPLVGVYIACKAQIRERHAPIDGAFGSGMGLLLQNRDSQMAEAIMLTLAARGVTVLPVHDSFIVRAEYESLLVSVMDAVLHDFFPGLAELSDGLNLKVTHADGTTDKIRSRVLRA